MRLDKWIGLLPFYLLVIILLLGVVRIGSGAVSVIAESTPFIREKTIIIDPGHGGVDGGATSCTGVLESNLNLEIALRLNDLMHFMGYQTVMIRTEDISVYTEGNTIAQKKISDLKERVRIINETENAILISIHQNTFSDSQYGGAQVFYAETKGSQELANRLQSNLIAMLNQDSNRKSKKADSVYLMKHIQTTGVLLECGFLSNPKEEALLRSDDYQKKLCCVIACVVSSFVDKA